MSHAEEYLPDGAVVTERLEIVGAISPSGGSVLSYHFATADGEPIELTRLMGLLERAKLDAWESQEDGEE